MTVLASLFAALAAYLIVSNVTRPQELRPVRSQRSPSPNRRPALAVRLHQLGSGLSPARYRATVLGSMLAVFVVVLGVTGTPAMAVPAAITVGSAPRAFYRRRHAKVLADRVAAWPEAIRDVLANLAVGHSLQRALCLLGSTGPVPLRDVWARFERNSLALDPTTALELVRDELADPVSDRVIEAFVAANERGQTIVVTILRTLADDVTRDILLVEQIRTGQTEVRVQAIVASLLPFAVLAFLVSSNEHYRVFYRSPGGWLVVGLGVAMAVGGWKLLTSLGRIPAEPRVFRSNAVESVR